jgi:hypothetical protein
MPAAVLPRTAGGANILTGDDVIVPLIGAGVKSKSAVVNAQRRLNCYLEPQRDQDKTPIAVYGTPGLTKVLDEGALPLPRRHHGRRHALSRAGQHLRERQQRLRLDRPQRGEPAHDAAGRISMATNETSSSWLVDGTNGYNYDISALAPSRRSPRRCSRARRR